MLETQRLILRSFCETDAEDVFEYLNEPMVNCFACMKVHSLEETSHAVKERMKDKEFYFAIVLKESGKVIGEINAMPETQDTFSPCWMLNKEYHGMGYAYEAAYAFFDYLFLEKGARRIYAYTEDYNISSQNLCEKLGMRREGMFMEFVSFINDENGDPIYENTIQYAILKKEWIEKINTLENRELFVSNMLNFLSEKYDLSDTQIFVFGSFLTEEFIYGKSDIDIGIYSEDEDKMYYIKFELKNYLEKFNLEYDIVIMHLSKELWINIPIMTYGRQLTSYENDNLVNYLIEMVQIWGFNPAEKILNK
jgi:RimJ/RimL family protein N-acetyltransferase/predicted nucleotidyltransferase